MRGGMRNRGDGGRDFELSSFASLTRDKTTIIEVRSMGTVAIEASMTAISDDVKSFVDHSLHH